MKCLTQLRYCSALTRGGPPNLTVTARRGGGSNCTWAPRIQRRRVSTNNNNSREKRNDPPTRQYSYALSPDGHLPRDLINRLAELDQRLNYQGWHTLRWTSLVLAIGGVVAYMFRENVSSGVGDAASEVTRRTLENQDVQQQASALARGVVYELLNDKRALDLASEFVNEVIQRETTKVAVLGVVQDVLARKETEDSLRGLFSRVLTHPDSAHKAVEFLQHVVAIPESRDALVTVLSAVLAQPTTQAITSEFFKGVMQTETFTTASNKLGNDTVTYLLNNDELRAAAVAWCNLVLNDPALQNTAGEAVWNAVKGAFVPWGKNKILAPPNAVPTPPGSPTSSHGTFNGTSGGTSILVVPQQAIDAIAVIQGDKVTLAMEQSSSNGDLKLNEST